MNLEEERRVNLWATEKDFDQFGLVFDLIKFLQLNNEVTWRDEYGTTVISMGRNLVSELLQKLERDSRSYALIISPLVEDQINRSRNHKYVNNSFQEVDNVISIGGAAEHNLAKEILLNNSNKGRTKLITVPVPLSNDSFGTNRSSSRFGKIEEPSRKSHYPSRIIVDFDLLDHIADHLSVVGTGEVIGLYYSLYDYCRSRNLPVPKKVTRSIEINVRNLVNSLKDIIEVWLKYLAITLIGKCFIMRAAKDHQIGASGDHLIAYALEYCCKDSRTDSYRKLPHGEWVYLGSIAMAALFPDWEYGFFSLGNLIDVGMEMNILESEDLNLLIETLRKDLIALALRMRPARPTSLFTLSPESIEMGCVKIAEYANRYFDV